MGERACGLKIVAYKKVARNIGKKNALCVILSTIRYRVAKNVFFPFSLNTGDMTRYPNMRLYIKTLRKLPVLVMAPKRL